MKIRNNYDKPKLSIREWIKVLMWTITKNPRKKLKCPICGKQLFVINGTAFRDFEPLQVICADENCKFNKLKLSPI